MTITLNFMVGGAMRKVVIKKRKISFLTAELNNVPLKIDLDKLEEQKEKLDKMEVDKEFLKELSRLQTENEIALDIQYDFEKSGWRRMRG